CVGSLGVMLLSCHVAPPSKVVAAYRYHSALLGNVAMSPESPSVVVPWKMKAARPGSPATTVGKTMFVNPAGAPTSVAGSCQMMVGLAGSDLSSVPLMIIGRSSPVSP